MSLQVSIPLYFTPGLKWAAPWVTAPECQSFTLCLARLGLHQCSATLVQPWNPLPFTTVLSLSSIMVPEHARSLLLQRVLQMQGLNKGWLAGNSFLQNKFCWVCWVTDFIHVVLGLGENKNDLHWTELL